MVFQAKGMTHARHESVSREPDLYGGRPTGAGDTVGPGGVRVEGGTPRAGWAAQDPGCLLHAWGTY